jgi:hypothetical protein
MALVHFGWNLPRIRHRQFRTIFGMPLYRYVRAASCK